MNTNQMKADPRRKGSVLFAALAVVLTVTVLASCLLQLSAITAREQTQGVDTKRAFYLAESGLSEAWYGIKIGKSGNVGTPDLPGKYGDGLLWVEAKAIGGGRTSLVSTGLCGTGRFSLSMVVEQDGSSVGALGFFADLDLAVGVGARVDSYDSSQGPYEAPMGLPGAGGPSSSSRVASNGDIEIDGSPTEATVILGDVQPGPQGSVIVGEGVTIAGSTAPASNPVSMPEIDVPSIVLSANLIVGARGALNELPTGDSHYGLIKVPYGQVLTINGPATVVADNFLVEPGGRILINASLGPVAIFATESLVWEAGSLLTCLHEDPSQLSLQISANLWVDRDEDGADDPPAVFLPTGQFLGTLYAPESPIVIAAETEVFGAVAAQSLTLSDGVQVHFDEALAVVQGGAGGGLTVAGWRIVDLPDVAIVKNKMNPLQVLKAEGVEAPLASQAHEVVMFKIHFLDWLDVDTYFMGDEAKFNWANVKIMIEVAREGDANFNTI